MIIHWKKSFFKINDIYGTEYKPPNKADVYCYFQQHYYIDVHKKASLHKKTKTLCIHLQQAEDKLRTDMNRTTRYQINRAERDNVIVTNIENPSKQDVKQFIKFYNPFAEHKGIEKARYDKLDSLRENNQLTITHVNHRNGERIASHLYIVNGIRATMFYSASGRFAENEIKSIELGRANRYLHWRDILLFRNKGYVVYDFLGLSINKYDREQQNINKFKKGFGGREEYHCQSYVARTIKGRVLLLLLRWKWRHQEELVQRSTILKEQHSYKNAAN